MVKSWNVITYLLILDSTRLVSRLDTVCPENTYGCAGFGCPNTCYCEDHCSWEKCVLSEAPNSCGTDTNISWHWNSMYWVAKIIGRCKKQVHNISTP